MQVRITKTIDASPNGFEVHTYEAGQVYNLPPFLAKIVIDNGWGVLDTAPQEVPAEPAPDETPANGPETTPASGPQEVPAEPAPKTIKQLADELHAAAEAAGEPISKAEAQRQAKLQLMAEAEGAPDAGTGESAETE